MVYLYLCIFISPMQHSSLTSFHSLITKFNLIFMTSRITVSLFSFFNRMRIVETHLLCSFGFFLLPYTKLNFKCTRLMCIIFTCDILQLSASNIQYILWEIQEMKVNRLQWPLQLKKFNYFFVVVLTPPSHLHLIKWNCILIKQQDAVRWNFEFSVK